jgi:hypothetical protein
MNKHVQREGSWPFTVGVVLVAIAALLMLNRSGSWQQPPQPDTPAESSDDPQQLLRSMIDKYRSTAAYADAGELTLRYLQNKKSFQQNWPAQVRFVRPGRIHVRSFNLTVASDNSAEPPRFYAQLQDPETNHLDGQVLAWEAPKKLSLEDFSRDVMLADQLGSRLQRPPVQLELLLNEKPLESLFQANMEFSLLPAQKIDGVSCQGVRASDANGSFTFWIDAETQVLRRIEYPAKQLLPELAADPAIEQVELVCDLHEATFQPKVAELDFSFQPTSKVHYVKNFIPPPKLSDTRLLGKPISPFEFVSSDGKKIDNASINGKITALLWYAHHPVCEAPAKAFAEMVRQHAQQPDIALFAICTEPTEVGEQQLRAQLAAWKVELPVGRDLQDFRSSVFGVGELPTVIVLDARGKVASILVGPEGVAVLPKALERLQQGEDLAQEALAKVALIREQYQYLLSSGGVNKPKIDAEPEKLAPMAPPQQLQLAEAWRIENLPEPSGILARDAQTLLAIADEREVWEINPRGEVTAKHVLPLPEHSTIDALRAWKSKDHWYYAGFNMVAPGVFIFDEKWQLLGSYGHERDNMSAVSDVQFAPWGEQDEPLLLVSHLDSLGLHAVSLRGEVVWRNRQYVPIASICLSHPLEERGQIGLLTGKDSLGMINRYGNEDPERKVPGWSFAELEAASFPSAKQAAYGAIGENTAGEPCLIGLNAEYAEQWNYPLPKLDFVSRMDSLLSAKLRKQSAGEWIAALPNGTVHVVSEDGEFNDTFSLGKHLRAIATLEDNEQPLLVFSTSQGIVAWKVNEKAAAENGTPMPKE